MSTRQLRRLRGLALAAYYFIAVSFAAAILLGVLIAHGGLR